MPARSDTAKQLKSVYGISSVLLHDAGSFYRQAVSKSCWKIKLQKIRTGGSNTEA